MRFPGNSSPFEIALSSAFTILSTNSPSTAGITCETLYSVSLWTDANPDHPWSPHFVGPIGRRSMKHLRNLRFVLYQCQHKVAATINLWQMILCLATLDWAFARRNDIWLDKVYGEL